MSNIITTGSNISALQPGLFKGFGIGYKEHESYYDKIFEVRPSDKVVELFYKSGNLDLPDDMTEGDAIKYHSMSELWNVKFTQSSFGLGIRITDMAMKFLKDSPILQQRGAEMGRVMRLHKELAAAAYLDGGADNAVAPGGDGVALYSASHPTATGNQSNYASVAADISELALEAAHLAISSFLNEQGQLIDVRPKNIIVAKDNRFEIHRILNAIGQVYTPDNTPNAIKDMGAFPGVVIVNPHLTDTDAFHVTTDAAPGEGLLFLVGQEPVMSSSNDFDTDDVKFKTVMRYTKGHLDWRCAYLNPGV